MKRAAFLLLAALLLGGIAHLRAAEYDESYSIFLTAGDARPAWPAGVFTAGSVRGFYSGHASLAQISHDLKTGDVHPPLYFWALESWRRAFGASWFAARMLSVLFSVGSLAFIGAIADTLGIAALPAMTLALLSYGFAYTGIVARSFALAQFLNLLGFFFVVVARQARQSVLPGAERRRLTPSRNDVLALLSGVAFGAASFSNYLAIFTACGALAWLAYGHWRSAFLTAIGMLPFAALDATYFLAQRNSRAGQFAAFSPLHAAFLLVKNFGAALFGGLPLYTGGFAPIIAAALLVLFLTCIVCVIKTRPRHATQLALAAIATPLGLLALGFIFHNTPIEIRYLSFSLPFIALLFAAALPRSLRLIFIAVQACAILGLAIASATMQPQALAARQAAAFPGALILLPFGNDGVGVLGPFIAALPGAARLQLLRPGVMPNLTIEKKIILATIRADDTSRKTTTQALEYFRTDRCFTAGPATKLIAEFLNRCPLYLFKGG